MNIAASVECKYPDHKLSGRTHTSSSGWVLTAHSRSDYTSMFQYLQWSWSWTMLVEIQSYINDFISSPSRLFADDTMVCCITIYTQDCSATRRPPWTGTMGESMGDVLPIWQMQQLANHQEQTMTVNMMNTAFITFIMVHGPPLKKMPSGVIVGDSGLLLCACSMCDVIDRAQLLPIVLLILWRLLKMLLLPRNLA